MLWDLLKEILTGVVSDQLATPATTTEIHNEDGPLEVKATDTDTLLNKYGGL